MKLLHGFDDPAAYRGGYVAIGNFDGVHRGHQSMLAALVRHARREQVPAVVLTFDPPPIALLRPQHTPPQLSTLAGKAELFEQAGVDCAIVYPTDWNLLHLTPEEFFEQIVRGRLQARGLVEGPNFFFGRNRAGNVETLRRLCDAAGLTLEVVAAVRVGTQLVSSSAIRERIAAGQIAQAVEMLGHPYRIGGRVVRGAARGAALGFPTANLGDIQMLLPPDGVYAGVSRVDGRIWPAAVHCGPNATFGENRPTFEVHLVGFAGDLYDQPLAVDLLDRVRDTARFAGPEELQAQLARDVEAVAKIAESHRSI